MKNALTPQARNHSFQLVHFAPGASEPLIHNGRCAVITLPCHAAGRHWLYNRVFPKANAYLLMDRYSELPATNGRALMCKILATFSILVIFKANILIWGIWVTAIILDEAIFFFRRRKFIPTSKKPYPLDY